MKIQENILLSNHTTLRIGGPAKFFAEARDEEEIKEAVNFAGEKNLMVFVLGGGSNILVSDKGFDGLVIKMLDANCRMQDAKIECGAGAMLGKAVKESVKAGVEGLEWAAGIPGTIGGAIRGNAGAFGGEIASVVESVKVLDSNDLQVVNYDSRMCGFVYRGSVFKKNSNLLILSATLKLREGDQAASELKLTEIIAKRKAAQPFDFPSSGSFFKNPVTKNKSLIEEFEKDTGQKAVNNVIPAGYIIDILNLRGKKIGGAMVSQHHGNFLVNADNAQAEDFIILAAIIKTRARNKFGIQLQEEVQMVGF